MNRWRKEAILLLFSRWNWLTPPTFDAPGVVSLIHELWYSFRHVHTESKQFRTMDNAHGRFSPSESSENCDRSLPFQLSVYSSFHQALSIMFTAIMVVRVKTSIAVQCVNISYKKIRIFIRIRDRWSRRRNVWFLRRSNGNRHLHLTRLCVIESMIRMMSMSCKMFRVHTERVEKRRMPRLSTSVWKINPSIGLSWSMLTTNIQQMMMMYFMFVCEIGRRVLVDRIFFWLEWFTHE